MKKCSKCHEQKSLDEFGKDPRKKSGLTAQCRKCKNIYAKSYWAINKGKFKESQAKRRELYREWHKEYSRKWLQNNLERHSARERKRNACVKRATPIWLEKEQIKFMKSMYLNARILSKYFQAQCEVDHIIPIQSKLVSGLHVPWNLQIVTKEYNQRKSTNTEVSYL